VRRTCDGKENGVNLLDPCVARPAAHPPARVHRVHRALRGRTHPPRTPWPRRSRCPHLVAIMALLCTQGTDMLGAVPQGAWPRPVRGPWSPAYAARPGAEGGKTKGLSPPRARARARAHTHMYACVYADRGWNAQTRTGIRPCVHMAQLLACTKNLSELHRLVAGSWQRRGRRMPRLAVTGPRRATQARRGRLQRRGELLLGSAQC